MVSPPPRDQRPLHQRPHLRDYVAAQLRSYARRLTGGSVYVDADDVAVEMLTELAAGVPVGAIPDLPAGGRVGLRRVPLIVRVVTCCGCGTVLGVDPLCVATDDHFDHSAQVPAEQSVASSTCCSPTHRISVRWMWLPDVAVVQQ